MIVSTFRTPLEKQWWENTSLLKRNCDGAREIAKNSANTSDFRRSDDRIGTCSRIRSLCNQNQNNHRSSARTRHRDNGASSCSWVFQSWSDDQWQQSSELSLERSLFVNQVTHFFKKPQNQHNTGQERSHPSKRHGCNPLRHFLCVHISE